MKYRIDTFSGKIHESKIFENEYEMAKFLLSNKLEFYEAFILKEIMENSNVYEAKAYIVNKD